MKTALFFAFLTVSVYLVSSQSITNWGNVYSGRVLYEERVYASRPMFGYQNRTVNYPPRNSWLNAPIRGIRHIDWKRPQNAVNVSIRRGGLGFNHTSIQILSQTRHGINSTVLVYG